MNISSVEDFMTEEDLKYWSRMIVEVDTQTETFKIESFPSMTKDQQDFFLENEINSKNQTIEHMREIFPDMTQEERNQWFENTLEYFAEITKSHKEAAGKVRIVNEEDRIDTFNFMASSEMCYSEDVIKEMLGQHKGKSNENSI